MINTVFGPHLARWQVTPDGACFETHTSHLMPVRRDSQAAMLKVFKSNSDEKTSAEILGLFDGAGMVRLLAGDDASVVLERLGPQSCLDVESDAHATGLVLDVVKQLHQTRIAASLAAIPLQKWFQALFEREGETALHQRCAGMARMLLDEARDVTVLHGDIHHGNILESPRGWLALDPKGLLGERTYDVANLFGNPLSKPDIFLDRTRMIWLARESAMQLDLDAQRVLQFAFAFAGLSASWPADQGEEDTEAALRLRSAEILEDILAKGDY